ncbi:Uncharacterised protein [Neisseria sicca]|nr:Uncharacterised protein [Neisseria sicca]
MQLSAVDGIGAACGNGACGDAGHFLTACVDTLGSDVDIACFQTVFAQRHFVADVDAVVVHNRIACFDAVYFQVFVEADLNAVRACGGGDVGIAFNRHGIAQFVGNGRTAVACEADAFVVYCVFRRYAFGDVGFDGFRQVNGVVGYVIGVFVAFGHDDIVGTCGNARAVCVHGVNGLTVRTLFAAHAGNVGTGFDFGLSGGSQTVQLSDVGGIGVFHTGGNVADGFVAGIDAVGGDVDIACFQTVFAQCHFVADFDAVVVHNGIACGEAVGFEVGCGRHFVSGAAVGILLRCDDDVVVAAVHFGCRFRCGCFELRNVHCVGVVRTFGYVGNFVATVVQTVFGQADRFACFAVAHSQSVVGQNAAAYGYFVEGDVV